MPTPPMTPAVAQAFAAVPEPARAGVLRLRGLIFDVAADLPQIGRVEEALRWGQPSYLTPDRKAASPLRLGVPKTGGFALFAHCQSQVIPAFRALHEADFAFEGNRAVLFSNEDDIKPVLLAGLIRHALTYHLRG